MVSQIQDEQESLWDIESKYFIGEKWRNLEQLAKLLTDEILTDKQRTVKTFCWQTLNNFLRFPDDKLS